MNDLDFEIIMECTKHRDGIRHTDLVNNLKRKTGASVRTIKNKISEHDGGSIIRQTVDGYGYPLYFINSKDSGNSHRLYMLGTKKDSFFSQQDVSDIIKINEDHYTLEIENKDDGVYSNSASTLVSALYWHQKLTFAIFSGYFGNSKNELELAKNNRTRIEKLISKIYLNAGRTDFDLFHDLLHGVHDIIELNRKLSKDQLRKIWSS